MADRARLRRHGEISTRLALLSDERLARRLDEARVLGAGVGGATALLDVGGAPVFVKRIPLTELERRPEHVRSTANLFGMPAAAHYSVVAYSSGGFGAWRELAANIMTTNWVLAGQADAFPLLHHWRVLPGAPPPTEEHADVERVVAYWDGDAAVRRRLAALARAEASVGLFLEHVPHRLDEWLAGQDDVAAACGMVEERLGAAVAAMNAGGLLHFDAHFRNVLTDGRRLYLADLGLATSSRFELSEPERAFVAHHQDHDARYVHRELLNWIVTNVVGIEGHVERFAYLRRCADGARAEGVPGPLAGLIARHAPVAAAMNDFYADVYSGPAKAGARFAEGPAKGRHPR